MNDIELDEMLNQWVVAEAPASLRGRVKAGMGAAPDTGRRRPSWRGGLVGAAIAGVAALLVTAVRAVPQTMPEVHPPYTVESEFVRYAEDGTTEVSMEATSYSEAGKETILSRSMPGSPVRTEAARALEALTRLASPLLLKMAGTSEGQLAKMRAAAKDRSSVVTECGDRYCLTVAHYVFQRADAAKGCVEGEVVGRETILGYPTAAQRIVLGDGRRITVWMAPELGCFALKVTTEDRESRVLSGREAVRVDR
jgi:hypothetical protein